MAKTKAQYFWIDAFNLFHRWHATAIIFKNNQNDVRHAHEIALRTLSEHLGNARNRTTAFMDGGVSAHSATIAGLKIRYPGPGKKADDLLEEAARAGINNRRIAVITSDNFLAATMRRNSTKILSCEDFIANYLKKKHNKSTDNQQQIQKLTEDEVNEWLDIFSDDLSDES